MYMYKYTCNVFFYLTSLSSVSSLSSLSPPSSSPLIPPRIWDVECGACLRLLEGHEELVRCIRFDDKRIVSGAYDG